MGVGRVSPTRGAWLRDWLVRFLFVSTALQSFDGLVQRAARYHQFGTSGPAATWLPRVWALTVDAIWYAGLLGVQRYGGRDVLSWLMFVVAFGASFGFQVIAATDVPVAAVAPVALLLVLIVMHAPRRAEIEATPASAEKAAGNAGDTAAVAAPVVEDRGGAAPMPAGTGGVPALPARLAMPVDRPPPRRERPMPAGTGKAAVPATRSGGSTVPADPDQAMRAYWAGERAKGCTPGGAELDRVVGRNPDNGAGRKARARYLREEAEGRFTVPAGAVPGPAPATVPAQPFRSGALAARAPAGNAPTSFPPGQARPAGPAAVPVGNGYPARAVVPAALDQFPARDDGETTDA
jgi:hypothetical protein